MSDRCNAVPSKIETFLDAYYCGKEMAMLLNRGGWFRTHRARVWAKRWWAGYERGFTPDRGYPHGASRTTGGHWYLGIPEPIHWQAPPS